MLLQAQGKMASYSQVKELYPETLFSVVPNEKTMREMGHYVEPADRPEGDIVEMAHPTKNSKGVWQQNWIARDFTEDEIAEQSKATIPYSVSALSALLSLDAAGYAEAYDNWARDPARTFSERAFINKAQRWERNDETLLAAATEIGISKENLDQLFIDAAAMDLE